MFLIDKSKTSPSRRNCDWDYVERDGAGKTQLWRYFLIENRPNGSNFRVIKKYEMHSYAAALLLLIAQSTKAKVSCVGANNLYILLCVFTMRLSSVSVDRFSEHLFCIFRITSFHFLFLYSLGLLYFPKLKF